MLKADNKIYKILILSLLLGFTTFSLNACNQSKSDYDQTNEEEKSINATILSDIFFHKEIDKTYKTFDEAKKDLSINHSEEKDGIIYEGVLTLDSINRDNETNNFISTYAGILYKSEIKKDETSYLKYIVRIFDDFQNSKKSPEEIKYLEEKDGVNYSGSLKFEKGQYNTSGEFIIIYSGLILAY